MKRGQPTILRAILRVPMLHTAPRVSLPSQTLHGRSRRPAPSTLPAAWPSPKCDCPAWSPSVTQAPASAVEKLTSPEQSIGHSACTPGEDDEGKGPKAACPLSLRPEKMKAVPRPHIPCSSRNGSHCAE